MLRQIRYEKIYDLLAQQDVLKRELMETKSLLGVDRSTWSYDLYVAEQLDPEDPSFLEALEKETEVLQKRVDACKSHIMMVTTFDSKPICSSVCLSHCPDIEHISSLPEDEL
ncbi:unnamed protein product [Protopolystoma xenopodis]|uniref:Uncharacterized protein n=1 Tax=Protopolystoma xenopodis TaxID=117903 RepID=A0A3S5ARV1_9PLAT|nr:unnamed protein product [Protopolystoma xenopodis]